jgi:facilitated trehalose transporter
MFYVNQVFETAAPKVNLQLATFLFLFAQTAATFIESLIVDRFGRRLLFVISGFGCSIGLGMTGLYFVLLTYQTEIANQNTWLPLTGLILYIIAFSIGFAPIPWMMIPEMTPLESRGFVSACATALNWGTAFVIAFTFPDLCGLLGTGSVFFGFMVCTIIGTTFMLICLPETSGRSFDELRTRYAYGWKNSLFSATVSRRLSTSVNASNLNLPANDQLRVTTM